MEMSLEEEESLKKMGQKDLSEFVKFLDEQLALHKESKLGLYKPHKFQAEFHASDAKIRCLIGGNRPICYGSKVLMANGCEKVIEDIVIGDFVLAWDGFKSVPSRVIDVPFTGEEDCVEYVTKSGSTIQCTKDHCFPVYLSEKQELEGVLIKGSFADISRSGWAKKRFIYSGNKSLCRNDLIISEVRQIGMRSVRCIEIEHPSHYFVLANGIVTSNSGKTTCAVIEAIWLCLGLHPHHPRKLPVIGKLYADSFPMLMGTFFIKFKEWLHLNFLSRKRPYVYNQMGHLIGINFANGSEIHFGSYDQEERKAEGSAYDFVGFDEPPTRNLYIANLRGTVDKAGLIWFTCTPLSELWIYEELFLPGILGQKPHIKSIQCSSYDNPYLDKKEIELYSSELTEEERLVRIEGNFPRIQGVVIDTYDTRLSDVEPFELDEEYVIYEGHDPHPAKPNCTLWKALDRYNRRYVVRELKFAGGIYNWGKEIVRIREELCRGGARLCKSVIDTSINQKDLMMKANQYSELKRSLIEEGATILPTLANKRGWLDAGITKLKDLYRAVIFSEDEELFQIYGDERMPMEYVFKTCPYYKRELITYIWPKDFETDGVKPVAKNDDLISCNRYIESLAPEYTTENAKRFHRYAERDAYKRIAR